jgi:metal-dependent hydrolase (beta-lactamase superfamily II)
LSLLITAYLGSARHTVLFDAGPEGATFLRNAEILGVDLSAVGYRMGIGTMPAVL